MEVDYSWLLNGSLLKKGRKASLVYVQQPGQYQCVLSVNDHVAKSDIVNFVIAAEKSNVGAVSAGDKLHRPTKPGIADHQEQDGIVILI